MSRVAKKQEKFSTILQKYHSSLKSFHTSNNYLIQKRKTIAIFPGSKYKTKPFDEDECTEDQHQTCLSSKMSSWEKSEKKLPKAE
jgi:hypothetical protein